MITLIIASLLVKFTQQRQGDKLSSHSSAQAHYCSHSCMVAHYSASDKTTSSEVNCVHTYTLNLTEVKVMLRVTLFVLDLM